MEEEHVSRPTPSGSCSARGLRLRHGRTPGVVATVLLLTATLGIPEGRTAMAGERARPASVAQATGNPAGRPTTIRGTVVGLEGERLRVATASGPGVIRLVQPLAVTGATRASLGDIVPGTFLGTAARAQPDGSASARSRCTSSPNPMRGTGEGHRPMDAPGTTMTNANVDAVVQRADGPMLTLKHKDGVTQVLVPPNAPIVRFGPGDLSLLVPGASIVVSRAGRAADGTFSASRLTVGVDGAHLSTFGWSRSAGAAARGRARRSGGAGARSAPRA